MTEQRCLDRLFIFIHILNCPNEKKTTKTNIKATTITVEMKKKSETLITKHGQINDDV